MHVCMYVCMYSSGHGKVYVLIRSLEALSNETKHTKIHCRKCVCMYVCMYVQYASKKIPVSVPLNGQAVSVLLPFHCFATVFTEPFVIRYFFTEQPFDF